jgi:hypothetical protein
VFATIGGGGGDDEGMQGRTMTGEGREPLRRRWQARVFLKFGQRKPIWKREKYEKIDEGIFENLA